VFQLSKVGSLSSVRIGGSGRRYIYLIGVSVPVERTFYNYSRYFWAWALAMSTSIGKLYIGDYLALNSVRSSAIYNRNWLSASRTALGSLVT